MKCFIYITWNKYKYIVNYSFDPFLDLKYHNTSWDSQQLQLLTPPMPLGVAYSILNSIADKNEQIPKEVENENNSNSFLELFHKVRYKETSFVNLIYSKIEKASKELKKWKIPNEEFDLITLDSCLHTKLPKKDEIDKLLKYINGRILFFDEIEELLSGQAVNNLENVLQIAYLKGALKLLPSVYIEQNGKAFCFRCGGTEYIKPIYCFECGNEFSYHCEECLSMGESKVCRPLYCTPGIYNNSYKKVKYSIKYELTLAQKKASLKLLSFINETNFNEAVVCAVCGAGKTEITFAVIEKVIKDGGKVLYAVPRKQVVIELAERIKKAFKNIKISVLYGGNKENYCYNNLVLSTTHQAVRFYKNFDLVILDENDAYPYKSSRMLHYFVKRACKDDCKIIYMTATPRKELLKKMKKGIVENIMIPARHHGYTLPVPQIHVEKKLLCNEQINISKNILNFLHLTLEGDLAQIIIFVPTIDLADKAAEVIQKALKLPPFNNFNGDWVQFSHSKDPERDIKVKEFTEGKFPVFITTTIMERGVTLPRVNVIVLFADADRIFDMETLVQMAGRSGRLENYPNGRVWYIARRITTAMNDAVLWIKDMNKNAENMGYIKNNMKQVIKDVK